MAGEYEHIKGKGNRFSSTNQPANRGRKKSAYKELLELIKQGGGNPLSYEEYKKMSAELLNCDEEAIKLILDYWGEDVARGIKRIKAYYTIEKIKERDNA